MSQAVEARVKAIIVNKLGVGESDVDLEKSFIDDLGADSLDIVELMMEIEDAFNMEIPDTEAENIRTVGDAVQYISQHQS